MHEVRAACGEPLLHFQREKLKTANIGHHVGDAAAAAARATHTITPAAQGQLRAFASTTAKGAIKYK